MLDVRSRRMRGSYHRLLIGVLLREMARQSVTQESMAAAVKMHQTTVGDILRQDAGTFDLDEADALLRNIGSSLVFFTADPAHAVTPPPERRSKIASQLHDLLLKLNDEQLVVVLGTARSVRSAHGAKTQSKRRRGSGQGPTVRKTGETR